jgi:hypothetical protein
MEVWRSVCEPQSGRKEMEGQASYEVCLSFFIGGPSPVAINRRAISNGGKTATRQNKPF